MLKFISIPNFWFLFFRDHVVELTELLKGARGVCLTSDGWSSERQDSFMSTTCHFIDKDWVLQSVCVGLSVANEPHTKEEVSLQLLRMIDQVSGDVRPRVFTITTDNGRFALFVFFST
jgi:hypothetical protein